MRYTIAITETTPTDENVTVGGDRPARIRKIYEQVVDTVDLHAIILAVNSRPRRRRGSATTGPDGPGMKDARKGVKG